jgi:hypothetical protein
MATYMCDGNNCGFTGTEEEVVAHVLSDTRPYTCWGAMQIGGPAWEDFLKGIHPMTTLANAVAGKYTDYVLEQNGIKT